MLNPYCSIIRIQIAKELKTFIEANDLDVCYKNCEVKTFVEIPGSVSKEVNTDVPTKTKNVNVTDRNVYDEENSDHRLINLH